MARHIPIDADQLARMRAAYENGVLLSVLAVRFGRGLTTMQDLCKKHGWVKPTPPVSAAAVKQTRPKVSTFTQFHKPMQVAMATELDRAKTILRRTGRVVFDASITDGFPGRGLVKVDGKNMPPAEVILRAAQLDMVR